MGCCKGESEVGKKATRFSCEKCGAKVKKKSHVCKPVKVSGGGKPHKKAKSCGDCKEKKKVPKN